MNKGEAKELLADEIARLRQLPYEELLAFLRRPGVREVVAESGTRYDLDIEAFWYDRKEKTNLRVMVSVARVGSWRMFVPLSESFMIASDGSFVGEQEDRAEGESSS